MSKVIGIDLGTSNSCVSVIDGGSPVVITNEEGSRTTPSIVAYAKDEIVVGNPAKRQAVTNAENTVYSAKRFIGMRYEEVEKEATSVPFKVRKGKSGMCEIRAGKDFVQPQAISAQVLIKLKEAAENYLGSEVQQAVITVPAYFNDAQRQATRDAGKIAGLEVKRIINEPTAAALAYGLDKDGDKNILVYDLGGGTFDVSVLEIGEGVVEVKSTSGDTHLGGDDIDNLIVDWMISEFKKQTGVDVNGDSMVIQRLREAAERAKIELSSTQSTNINLPFLTANNQGPQHLQMDLTRAKFEKMIDKIVTMTMAPVQSALNDASLEKSDIDEILMVGGSTRIPLVREQVEKYFNKSVSANVNPDEVVALGAAVQGGVFSGETNDILLLDVTPLSLGLETMGGVMTKLINRNTTIPCSKTQVFTTAEDNQQSVDIKVMQGEREMASDNKMLGNFRLDGIPPSPRGVPQIEVTFDINADGLVSVRAKDQSSGKEQNITITGSGAMSPEEVDRLIQEAEENKQRDAEKRKLIENQNQLESMVFQSEKMLNENEDSLPQEVASTLREKIETSRKAISDKNPEDIMASISALSEVMQSVGQHLQEASKATSAGPQEGPEVETMAPNEDVIDAEFTEAS